MAKLTPGRRKELMIALCRAISTLRKADEVAEFLLDFFSPKEIETISKRLRIAELLAQNKNYEEIRSEIKVGYSTIARVNTWLNLSGKGFKLVLERKREEKEKTIEEKMHDWYDPYSWANIKRRYSLYFWPQLLLEELLKRSNEKEKEKIKKILDDINLNKKRFNKEENKMLYNQFKSNF